MNSPLHEPVNEYKHVEIVEYDPEKGVVAMYDEHTRHEYEVRAGMLEKMIRQATIVELERLGYTVTEPGRQLTNDEYRMLDLIRGLVRVYNCWTATEVNELDIDSLLQCARGIVEESS
jgi:hypothetical protein